MPRPSRPAPPARERLTVDGQAVEIRRSPRRTRTIQARLEDGIVVVLTPARMSRAEERVAVEKLVRRVVAKGRSARNDDELMARAARLRDAHLPTAPAPSSVRWVSNMTTRWGSCTVTDSSIRLSDTMIGMPDYVVDGVLLHELAHLVERGHGPRFQALVRRHPDHARVEAYLAGASFGARRRPGSLPEATDVDDAVSDEDGDNSTDLAD